MGKFTVFSQHLVIQVTPELHTLLKVVLKAHPELQVILFDIQHNKPTWIVGGVSAVPKELDFASTTTGEWENKLDELVDLNTMHCAKSALGKVSLPSKVCIFLGKAVHVQFDGRS